MTTDELTTNRLHKIEALLRKAESTEHPAEAETFTAKAHALMTEWAIDEAALRMAKPKEHIAEDITSWSVTLPAGATQSQDATLLGLIAQALDLKYFYYSGARTEGKRPGRRYEVFGFPDTLQRFEMLFESLKQQRDHELNSPAVKAAQRAEAEAEGYWSAGAKGGHSLRFRNAFAQHFAQEVYHRLRQTQKVTAAEYHGKGELVLASQAAIVSSWFDEGIGKRLRAGSGPSTKGSRGGAAAGRVAGQRASIASGALSR